MNKWLETSQRSFAPYANDLLPHGFRYPSDYLALSKGIDSEGPLIWWFTSSETGADRLEWELRYHWQSQGWRYLDDIDPIPFARNGDWAAFFDGNDHSGNPRVVVADLGNKDNSYKVPNFGSWLERALEQSGLK